MKNILSTVTSVSELYSSFIVGGETGWFAFVRGEQKFYEWKETWSEVLFTDTLIITSWRQEIVNGIYNVTNNATDTPTGLTGALKMIVFTNYAGKQVKVVQCGDKAYFLENGEVKLIWELTSPLTPLPRRGEQECDHNHNHHNHIPTGTTDFRYLQDPVDTIDDLPLKFPQGGELGFFAFVKDKKTFAYWDVELGNWRYMYAPDQTIIVNDLTSGGTDKGLSAEMGKKLETDKQNKVDTNLTTTAKKIVDAINELKENQTGLVSHDEFEAITEGITTSLNSRAAELQGEIDTLDEEIAVKANQSTQTVTDPVTQQPKLADVDLAVNAISAQSANTAGKTVGDRFGHTIDQWYATLEALNNISLTPGPPGDTPYIGPNFNWWINGTDTGLVAQGQNASDVIILYSPDPSNPVDWNWELTPDCLYLKVSVNGGQNFSNPIKFVGNDGINAPYVVIQYTDTPDNPVSWDSEIHPGYTHMRISTNGGQTYTEAIRFIGSDGNNAPMVIVQYSQYTDITDNTLWHDEYLPAYIYMRTSTNGGQTFTGPIKVKGDNGADGGTGVEALGYAMSDASSDITAGIKIPCAAVPYAFTITGIRAQLGRAAIGALKLTIDIKKNGTSILSTLLTFDSTETTSEGAAVPYVMTSSNITLTTSDVLELSIPMAGGVTQAAQNLTLFLIGHKTI